MSLLNSRIKSRMNFCYYEYTNILELLTTSNDSKQAIIFGVNGGSKSPCYNMKEVTCSFIVFY